MRAVLTLGFLMLFFVGYSTSRMLEPLSFNPIRTSPDYDFIRQWVEQSDHYKESMDPATFIPWDIDELDVAYFDFDDDGVEEMLLSFTDVSSYYCGTAGCWVIFFQKREGQWQTFYQISGATIYPTEEKVLGYRTFYAGLGDHRYRWDGKQYQSDCPKKHRADMPAPFPRHCSEKLSFE